MNFDNKKRNLVNSDGDSYGFVDDIESLDFIRAEARLGQNLKTQLFLVYSLLALVPHCICPFFIGCWWLWVGGRCWLWGAGGCWCRLLGKVDEKYAHHHHQRGTKKLLSMKNMTAFGKNNLRGSARVTCLLICFAYVSLCY